MNEPQTHIAVLIPSLDPDGAMVTYIRDLKNEGFEMIILVDDGSSDATQTYFCQVRDLPGVTVLRHAVNQGKGRALKTGFHYILNQFSSQELAGVVTADADGQHSAADTRRIAERLCQEEKIRGGGIVLGTRNFREEHVPFKSRSGNQITTLVFHALYGKRIADTQTGLRGIPYAFLPMCLRMPGERFEYEIMMLIEAVREKRAIIEEPIETIYIDSNRATHFQAVRDSARIYRVLFRTFFQYTMSGIASFLIDIGLFALLTKSLFRFLPVSAATFGGTLLARVISSLFNYTVNQSIFSGKRVRKKTLLRYYSLCVTQMLCSWLLVTGVFYQLHWNTTLIKCLVDLLLFLISFQIQRLWVFGEDEV